MSTGRDLLRALSVGQVFDSIAVRIDGPRAWDEDLRVAWHISDEDTTYLTHLRNGALNHRPVATAPHGVTTLTLTRTALVELVTGAADLIAGLEAGTVSVEGDPTALGRLTTLLAPADPDFDIVTP